MANKNSRWTPDKVRERIKVGVITKRLIDHALGKIEMTSTQIKAAEILLRKAVPDLKALELSGTVTQRHVSDLSDAELAAIATGSGEGVADTQGSASEPPAVH